MLKTPVVIAIAIDGWYINDADGEYLCFVSRKFHASSETAETIVAAVNGHPALLEIAKERLAFQHRRACKPKGATSYEAMLEDGMTCEYTECQRIAAIIRVAGGECGT